jgi:hypothetical protein
MGKDIEGKSEGHQDLENLFKLYIQRYEQFVHCYHWEDPRKASRYEELKKEVIETMGLEVWENLKYEVYYD